MQEHALDAVGATHESRCRVHDCACALLWSCGCVPQQPRVHVRALVSVGLHGYVRDRMYACARACA
eukprot:6198472-Pleurochrysis_carterae.AAC.3